MLGPPAGNELAALTWAPIASATAPAGGPTRPRATAIVEQCRGTDLVTGYETAYALGFQLPFPYRPMAGPGSFGHDGLGGSVGFAHPGHGVSFGDAVNQMAPGVPADRRSVPLIEAVVACLP